MFEGLLFLLFLLTRLLNLTLLPIFNDESIYLSWGWGEIHTGNLYYSLFDGKQPLLMWIFGFAQNIFPDPLFAGRIVSVLLGFFTALGIYFLGKKYFSKKVGLFAVLLYIIIPIFTFYDRQALMESAISTVGVWSLYMVLRGIETLAFKYFIFLGILFGLGLFIKSNAILFLLPTIPILFLSLKKKSATAKRELMRNFLYSIIMSQFILLPLYMERNFSNILTMNSRYSYTFKELLTFPFISWLSHFKDTIELLFVYLTPLVTLSIVGGIYKITREKDQIRRYILLWFITPLLFFILTVKNPSPRYIVSLLPISTLFASYGLFSFFKKNQLIIVAFFICAIPLYLTIMQITNPVGYFQILEKVTQFSQKYEYVTGWPSGYGIAETVDILKNKSKNTKIKVGIRVDSGNPEDAMVTYFHSSHNIDLINFDIKTLQKKDLTADCLVSSTPFYFVSRDNQLAGMDKYLILEEKFVKPYSNRYVGIYVLQPGCKGKTVHF